MIFFWEMGGDRQGKCILFDGKAYKIDATVSSVFTHCSTNTKYNIEYEYYYMFGSTIVMAQYYWITYTNISRCLQEEEEDLS